MKTLLVVSVLSLKQETSSSQKLKRLILGEDMYEETQSKSNKMIKKNVSAWFYSLIYFELKFGFIWRY